MLASITWDISPEVFSLLGREVRWYGILWASAVFLTSYIVQRMYKSENLPEKWFDTLFLYVVVCLIIGARLGHVLFYDPIEYFSHPLSILKVWEGGLASHGGAIGMTIGVCLYSLKITNEKINWKYLGIFSLIGFILGALTSSIAPGLTLGWGESGLMGFLIGLCIAMIYTTRKTTIQTLDRLVIGVALGAASIRLGNLMNSEIYGGPTSLPWGFNFVRDPHWHRPLELGGSGALPAHPTQIYEACIYLIVFALGMFLFYKTNAKQKRGLILGISLIGIFLSRFLIEFIKNNQVVFEDGMKASYGINMGQLLSLPFIIWGIWLTWNALSSKENLTTQPSNSIKNKK